MPFLKEGPLSRRRNGTRPKESMHNKLLTTAKGYSAASTIHGLSYLTNPDYHVCSRVFWMLVVTLGLATTAIQMTLLYRQWNTNPVITTMETIDLPIEEIDFPAVTVCPQGYLKDILDNVLYHQLEDFIVNKTLVGEARTKRSLTQTEALLLKNNRKIFWNMTSEELELWVHDFLEDHYPGALDNPIDLVPLMISSQPERLVENEAVLRAFDKQECNENSNDDILNTMNRNRTAICPLGFTMIQNRCIMSDTTPMTYDEAFEICKATSGAQILHFQSYEDVTKLDAQLMLGTSIISHRFTYTYPTTLCFSSYN